MATDNSELSTYVLIRRYQSEEDKNSGKASELATLIRKNLNLPSGADLTSQAVDNKLKTIILITQTKNKDFINVAGWFIILVIILQLVGSGCNTMAYYAVAGFKYTIDIPLPEGTSPILKFILDNQFFLMMLKIILLISELAVAACVLFRFNAARKLAVFFLSVEIARNIIEPLLVKFVYSKIFDLDITIPKVIENSMYQGPLIIPVLLSAVFISLYAWLIYKLTNQDLVEEFN